MKKRDWILIALAAAVLICVLLLPGLVVRMQERKLLRQIRTADADLMAFAQEENTTLIRRMNIMASPSSAYTSLDDAEVGSRFGEPQLLAERCMEELLTLFPEAYRLEQLVRGAEVGFYCYVEPFSKQTMVVAACEFTMDDAVLTVGLDVAVKKIVSLELEGWNKYTVNSSKEKEPVYVNPTYATVVKNLQIDQDMEQWFETWAAYWGLKLTDVRNLGIETLNLAYFCEPADPEQRISYERHLVSDYLNFRPLVAGRREEPE